MAVEHVKSTPVTNFDATPAVANTAGEGGPGYLRSVEGSLTIPASSSIDSTFRFVQVPSNAVIKNVRVTTAAQTVGVADFGVYYPVSGKTGVADLAANAIDQDFFASAVDLGTALPWTDITFEAGAGYIRSEINTPLWEALGLASDPGGFLVIAATVTTAVTTGAGVAALQVVYSL